MTASSILISVISLIINLYIIQCMEYYYHITGAAWLKWEMIFFVGSLTSITLWMVL